MDRRRIPVGLRVPKKVWTIGVGRTRRRHMVPRHSRAVRQPSRGDTERVLCIIDLPAELINAILCHLPGRDLAAAALTCTVLNLAAAAEHLWQPAYRRDIDPDGPPIQHQDHLAYGKSTRWLYGLMRLPEGVLRAGPSGRLTGRLTQSDGSITSGEFTVGAPKGGTSSSHLLLLDGYGAVLSRQAGKWIVQEGFYQSDVRIDRGRRAIFSRKDSNGRQSRTADFTLRGPIVTGLHHGLCISEWVDGMRKIGEVVAGEGSGRAFCFGIDGHAFSGSMADDGRITGRGVRRTPDGRLMEYVACCWHGSKEDSVDLVTREPCGRTERALPASRILKDAGKHIVEYDNGLAGEAIVSVDGVRNTRVDMGGYVIVTDAERVLFIAVDSKHRDSTIAGRRWMADTSRETKPAKSRESVMDELAALAPTRPKARRDINAIAGLSRATRANLLAALDGAGLEATAPWTEATGPSAGCPEESPMAPYGVALPVGDDGPRAEPWVRCFLTGGMVPARDCTLYSSGRLYDAGQLVRWTKFERHDPETGDPVPAPTGGVLWDNWMHAVPSHILAYAAVNAFKTMIPANAHAHVARDAMVVRSDLIRYTAAECMGIALRPGVAVVCAIARASAHPHKDGGGSGDGNIIDGDGGAPAVNAYGKQTGLALLTPGFERITLRHIELRHPEWDPRGKWTFGPPSEPIPDDPTMGDHERQPRGAPDQFVHSHGIISVAFDFGASFVGARFTGVFFFGQRFECASFVAAALDRCAFVGCTFDDGCNFGRALLSGCRLYCCTNATGGAIEVDVLAKRGAIIA